jgi:hypothetical protein
LNDESFQNLRAVLRYIVSIHEYLALNKIRIIGKFSCVAEITFDYIATYHNFGSSQIEKKKETIS